MRRRSPIVPASALVALLALAAPAAALGADEETIISLPVARVAVDLGAPGPGVGDLSASDHAVLVGEAVAGSSLAANIVAGPPESGGRPAGVTSRIGFLSLALPDGALLALGTSFGTDAGVVPDGGRTIVDAPQVRAIVGGTGSRAGATGELTTINRDDDRYERIIRPAASAPAGEIVLLGTLDPVPGDPAPTDPPAPGALLTHRADLTRDGAAAGERLSVRIATATPDDADAGALALVVYRLPDGEVAAVGQVPAVETGTPDDAVRHLAIVGGTGAYAGARGEVVLSLLGAGRSEDRLRFMEGVPADGSLAGGTLDWTEALTATDDADSLVVRVAAPRTPAGDLGVAVGWTVVRGDATVDAAPSHLFLAVVAAPGGALVLAGTAIPGLGGGPTPDTLAVLGGTGDHAGAYGTLRLDDPAAAALDGALAGPG
ncbi:MAG: hypothetical protein ACKOTZ_09635 [Chloroflexota bacterium]